MAVFNGCNIGGKLKNVAVLCGVKNYHGAFFVCNFSPMKQSVLITILLATSCVAAAQSKTDAWLERLIRQQATPFLKDILNQPDTFHYQLIYTKIDRDKNNQPHFTNYY